MTSNVQLAMPTQLTAFSTHRSGYSKRTPNCQKCSQQGRKIRLKGHKRACPFRNCECPRCEVVSERQKLMAAQIKQRRRQRKASMMSLSSQSSGDSAQDLGLSEGSTGSGTAPASAADLSLLYGLLAQQSLANAALTTASNVATLPVPTTAPLPSANAGFPLLIDPAILAPQTAAPEPSPPTAQVPLQATEPAKIEPVKADAGASNPFASASTEELVALLTLLQQQRLLDSTAAAAPMTAPLPAAPTAPVDALKPAQLLNCAAMAALSAGLNPQSGGPIGSLNSTSSPYSRTNSFVDIVSI